MPFYPITKREAVQELIEDKLVNVLDSMEKQIADGEKVDVWIDTSLRSAVELCFIGKDKIYLHAAYLTRRILRGIENEGLNDNEKLWKWQINRRLNKFKIALDNHQHQVESIK